MPRFFFRLQRPDEHRDDDLASGCAEENCVAAEEAGLASASTASDTWLGKIREYAAVLRFPLWLGRPVIEHASERGVESSAQEDESWRRAMQRATIEPITALGSARRGGANEHGAAAERRVIFRLGGPL